jgi:putative intracellular protease/amidase
MRTDALDERSVHLLVFDGLSDWEPALALCELRCEGKMKVTTIGLMKGPITTMGGLRVIPDISFDELDPAGVRMLILPGGEMWEKELHPQVEALIRELDRQKVPVAAICGATIAMARSGVLMGRRHTSNGAGYLENFVPGYPGRELYVDRLAVRDGNIITASGAGSVEFTREILDLFEIYPQDQLEAWYQLFKYGRIPG